MLGRVAIAHQPEHDPDEPDRAGDVERGLPAGQRDDQGTDQRRQHCADIAARVEDAGGERAVANREPCGDRLDAGWEIAAFAEAEDDTGEDEPGNGTDHAVRGGRQAP